MTEEISNYVPAKVISAQIDTVDKSPAALMMTAIEKGFDLDKVARRWTYRRSGRQTRRGRPTMTAMASFKAEMPDD